MFNKSTILLATMAAFAIQQNQAATLTYDEWIEHELQASQHLDCGVMFKSLQWNGLSLTKQVNEAVFTHQNKQRRCWKYFNQDADILEYWFSFDVDKNSDGYYNDPTYIYIHYPNYIGAKPQVQCISTAQRFEFQCDIEESPEAQSNNVEDQQSTQKISNDTASTEVVRDDKGQADEEPSSSQDDSSSLSQHMLWLIIIGSVLFIVQIFIVGYIVGSCKKEQKMMKRVGRAAEVQERIQNQQNQAAATAGQQQNQEVAAREQRKTVISTAFADNADGAQQNDQISIGGIPAEQQYYPAMPPSNQDQSDPTNNV